MALLEEMALALEIYSIDVAFLDLTGVSQCRQLEQFGREVRERILMETGLTVVIGIAQTKTLAKAANFSAKKWSKTGGVVDLSDPAKEVVGAHASR